MTRQELWQLRQDYNLTQKSAAEIVGVSENTWQRWESGKRPIPETRNLIAELNIFLRGPRKFGSETPEPPQPINFATKPDPFTSLIRALELLRLIRNELKESDFLNDTNS